MNVLDRIALALLVVGGVNWGLVGIFRFDLVAWIAADRPQLCPELSTPWWVSQRCGAWLCCSGIGMAREPRQPAPIRLYPYYRKRLALRKSGRQAVLFLMISRIR